MPFFQRLESRLGLTRGDVTVTLFLALTSLSGFIYATFFDERSPAEERRELLALRMRHDSVVAAARSARMAELNRSTGETGADTVPAWEPLTPRDTAMDEAEERASKPAGGGGGKGAPAGPVNLNTASKEALMRLPGVGEKTAEAIIERRKHVPFRRVEDIMEVKGIGEKKFEKMKPYILVR